MRVEKSWGYEEILHNGTYCLKLLVYTKPLASSLHYHIDKHETFYIASGAFQVDTIGDSRRMGLGEFVVIPPNHPHRVRCIEPGTIVEGSSFDDPRDCVRLIPSEA
jgi:mannose-6-phosphate isomerase-like protein (cupin superfamily)